MQRRVAFAAALQHHPDLLILDEPTSGVDPLARARLWETIAATAAAGAGVLVTTHYLDEAGECGRLVIMADGRVVAEGSAAEITGGRRVSVVEAESWAAALDALEAAGLPAALAGRTLRVPGAGPAQVARALGALPARVSEAPATLEERFFELTRPGGPVTGPVMGPAGRTGRRAGDSGTREAILAASRKRFAEHGYDGATIRGIAADAGVDPALVHHFYGTKERLFAAAMRLPVVPGELLGAALAAGPADPAESLGEHLVRTVLQAWEVHEIRDVFVGLIRSASTSAQATTMLREFVTEAIVGRLSAVARPGGGADPAGARYRASLVASQVVGLGLTRYVLGLEPLAAADLDALVAAVGPTVDRYLTGDLG